MPNTERYKYLVQLTADLVSSYVSNNPVPPSSLQSLITDVHVSLSKLQAGFAAAFKEPLKPAVPIKNSVTGEYIVCLDDGRKFKTLRRHLAKLGMTADEYREKWGLSARLSHECCELFRQKIQPRQGSRIWTQGC